METILELKDVKKNYGKKEILKGINLTVQEGEIISVLGPSGCGKSTLLNIIAGILPLNAGQVFVRGKEMSSPHRVVPIEQRDMNMVFQDFALWPHMKARDNIIYGLKVRKTDKAQMQEKLHEVETLLHLDVQLRIEMRTEMAQLFRQLKTTVFHVTHDPSEAFAMADRIIVMNQGVIDQIATQPGPHVVGVDIFTAIANFFYILFYDTVDKVLQLFVIKFLMTPNISQF